MIPSSVIEDIRYRNDIEDVISSYLPLKRAGSNNLKGLCPFHSEKSPSFTVYKDTQSYYCFGCGAGGDVINFIMRQENLDYVSAVEFLARRGGIELPEFGTKQEENKGPTRTRILEMNREAAKYFRNMLFDERMGAPGRSYLLGERKLSSSVVKHFGLGYSPMSWNGIRDYLLSLGFTNDEMVTGFLCGKNDRGYFDYFRGRVMYPIIDVSGNIIAFGGRVLDDSKPKYLNTSDTPAFKKSRNLFALNYAKNSESDTMIVCEGYMDVISLHAAGFTGAVATLGTAITPDHARILKRYCTKCVLSYDSDAAGQKATDRAISILADVGIDARILVMEGAKDPDEYIKKFGRDSFAKLIDGSLSVFDFKIKAVTAKNDMSTADGRIKAAGELCREIAEVYSRVEREIYIKKTADALNIDVKSIQADVETAIRRKNRNDKKKQTGELIKITAGLSDRVNPDFAKRPKEARLEEDIIGMIMMKPELLNVKADGLSVNEDDFFTDLGRRIIHHIKEKTESGGFSPGTLSEEFTHEEVSRAIRMQNNRRDITNDDDTYITYLSEMRKEKKKKNSDLSLEELINAKRNN